jgi:hypothetical protein
MVNLGFSATEYGYKQFMESIVNMTTYDEIYIEKIVSVSSTINADILKVLEKCYTLPGLHTRIENSNDPKLSFLIIYFKWDGNHSALPIEINVSDRTGLSFDGVLLTSNKKSYLLGPDEEIRVSIKRNQNSTVGFTVRVKRQTAGGTVISRSGNLALFKEKIRNATLTREYKVEKISTRDLPQTSQSRWIAGGDEELHRFSTTELSGTFNLGIDGNKLLGNVYATYVEKISNNTAFETKHSYLLYTAPNGWRIAGYGIENEPFGSSMTNFGPIRQSEWISQKLFTNGPVQYYQWQGDSGRDQDQLEGCWIKPYLKDIVILLEKI